MENQPRQSQPLLRSLHRQGSYRWIIFAIGLALLIWLWITAGEVRHPGAVKRQWAVIASRILVVAGAVFFARIVLVTHEERVPVVYASASRAGLEPGEILSRLAYLRRRGYEDVPIDDIVMFVREARYVPRKCFGIVVEVEDIDQIDSIVSSETPHMTLIVGFEHLKSVDRSISLPYAITPAVRIEGKGDLLDHLAEAKELGRKVFGKETECALVESYDSDQMRRTARRSGFLCFFNGKGYNRYGDEPHFIRLLDVTGIVARRSGFKLWLSVQLFKGKFIYWPLALATGLGRVED